MLKIFIAQTKQGQYEASIPWIAELAEPLRGPSIAQLKEELMFRVLELVTGGLPPQVLDRVLFPPTNLQVGSVYVDIERKVDPSRPPVPLTVVTHVVVGGWDGEFVTHLWLPKLPGVCLAMQGTEAIYATATAWIAQWAEENMLDSLEPLESPYWGKIDELEVDLGFPPAILDDDEDPPAGKGRMRRPEALSQVATNLTHRAADESLPQAFGRESLVEELVTVLTSPRPVNVCLVGAPGVGKTSIIHEAVRQAFSLQRTYQMRRDFWETSGDRIIAGMSVIGQWEQRVTQLVEELSERQDLLVAQDLLGLIRAGRTQQGDSNVARFIEPALEQDRFAIVAEATEETFAMARAMAPGFVDKFRRVHVPELGWKDTLSVLTQLVRGIEGEHEVMRFAPDGIETILSLTRRFFKQDAFPGKAVRLTRQCEMAALRDFHETEAALPEPISIDTSFVVDVFHKQTGLPRAILEPGTGRDPRHIKDLFQERIYGQEDAVELVTSLVVTIEQGLTDPNRPLGALLLVGPSGVGKTETAKALSEQLFGSEERMIRFDMSEFNTPLSASRLIGTPQHPDGELTGKVRLQPFCVVLLDEIEKAHSDVHDLLLQVMGDGRLTDAAGRTVDFRNAIIIMTSNLGAGDEEHWLGFKSVSVADRALHYRRSVQAFFRPEFFNRIDHIVPYRALDARALRRIASRTLRTLLERRGLRQAQVMVDVDEALIDYLIKDAVDPRYGARTLARRIERSLIAPLARRLTSHRVEEGLTRVRVKIEEGDRVGLDLNVIHRAPRAIQTQPPLVPTTVQDARPPRPDWLAPQGRAPLDAQQLIEALRDLATRLDALEQRPELALIRKEYDALLSRFNDPASQQELLGSATLTEQLRQREVVIRRLDQARVRLEGILDPRGEGAYLFPMAQEIDRRKQRLWSAAVVSLDHTLLWLEVQLQSLIARQSDGATLMITGLAGPYSALMDLWTSILRALDEVFELELVFVEKPENGPWRPISRNPSTARRAALAVSTEAPGVLALFNTLQGYVWSPRQPSHGQHALMLVQHVDRGFGDTGQLIAALTAHNAEQRPLFTPDAEPDALIEFIEQRGQLHDLRLARSLPIPEARAENMRQFATRLVMERVAWRGDVYERTSRSGVWRALTAADLKKESTTP